MGNLATPEALVPRWDEVLKDPSLQDLPYKIELNAWGKVEMSPASNRHRRLQRALGTELSKQLPGGVCISECSILTRIGIRVPDVAWACAAFMAAQREQTPYGREKRATHLEAGAHEVWLVAEDGGVRYFDQSGEKSKSGFPLDITLPPPMDEYR